MMQMLIAVFQFWENFSRANPLICAYLYLLVGKVLIFGVFVLTVYLLSRLWEKPDQPISEVPWGLTAIAEVFFIYLAFQAIAVYFKSPFMQSGQVEGVVAVWALVEYVFLFVLLWFVLRFLLGGGLAQLGWRFDGLAQDWDSAWRGMLFVVVMAVLTHFLYWTELLTPSTKVIERMKLGDLVPRDFFRWMQMLLVLVVSPIAEETFYRGFIFPVLRKQLPLWTAMILLSAFFAAMHFQWDFFVLLFFMSLATTVAYQKTKRLLAPVLIHAFYNVVVWLGYFTY